MTQEALKLLQETLAGLKDVEKQVRELVAENKALKEALAQPEYQSTADKSKLEKVPAKGTLLAQPEPVMHTLNCVCGAVWDIKTDGSEEMVHTPYTTPPQRTWVGLTDEEKNEFATSLLLRDRSTVQVFEAIEAKLKEKNT